MKRIALIGAGAMGQALGGVLRRAGHRVRLWDADPARCPKGSTLEAAIAGADVVFLCVPSWCVREAAFCIRADVPPKAVVVTIAKGLEPKTGLTVDAVLRRALPKGTPLAHLGGATLAREVKAGRSAAVVVGGSTLPVARRVASCFAGTSVMAQATGDLRGVAACGVLKNVYAFGLGFAEGRRLGHNTAGRMVADAALEMSVLVPLLGGEADTALGWAGLGDLVATATSPDSRNSRTGREFAAKGKKPDSEGVRALPLLLKRLGRRARRFPLLTAITHLL